MSAQTHDLWELADSIGIPIEVNSRDVITGQQTQTVTVAGLKIPVPFKVVSSAVINRAPVVICRSLGNLGFLAAVRYKAGAPTTIWVLDLAKMGKPEGFLEVRAVASVHDVVEELRPAIVEQFDKDSQFRWHKVV
jgi:hypothetical protein